MPMSEKSELVLLLYREKQNDFFLGMVLDCEGGDWRESAAQMSFVGYFRCHHPFMVFLRKVEAVAFTKLVIPLTSTDLNVRFKGVARYSVKF